MRAGKHKKPDKGLEADKVGGGYIKLRIRIRSH